MEREQWKTRVGFLAAAIGSAIGLGNIWRFSYMCSENGGGAFLIPYFVALFTAGIPIMILEFGLGHRMRGSAPLSFKEVGEKWEWLGWWAVIFVMFGIVLYYAVIIAWCLNYFFYAFNLSWGQDPNHFFFQKFLGLTKGPYQSGGIRLPIVLSLAGIWFLNWIIIHQGVEKGVERANKIFIPLLILLTGVLVAWGITLPGAKQGIGWYLKPDFRILSKPAVWIAAYAQIFFSLSLGFGIMIAYASYLPKKSALVKNAFIISLSNCGYSVFAGFAVFSTLGYMAHSTGKPLGEIVQESIGLAFVVYPKVISLLPHFSRLFGVIFFLILIIAGLSSSISICEAFTAAIMDKYGYSRRQVVTPLALAGFLGGVIFTTGGGLYWLDIVDHFLTHYGLIPVGILECLLIGWIFKASQLRQHINQAFEKSLRKWWDICVKIITPLVLIGVLFTHLIKEFRIPYGNYPVSSLLFIGVGWLGATLLAAVLISTRPWRVAR